MNKRELKRYGICWYCNRDVYCSLNGGAWYHDDTKLQRCHHDYDEYASPIYINDFLKELQAL